MCGRFNLVIPDLDELRRYFPVEEIAVPLWTPRYNIAPSQLAPVLHIADNGALRLSPMSWGLLPHFAPNPRGQRPINARVESLRRRPTFRELVGRRQCIVPATGYYEWLNDHGRKQPWLIAPSTGVLAMAGLWDRWTSSAGEVVETFAVITTEAAPHIAHVHDRMPLLIEPVHARTWLGGPSPAAHLELVNVESLTANPISNRVNSPRNDDPSILAPEAPATEVQLTLGLGSPSRRLPSGK